MKFSTKPNEPLRVDMSPTFVDWYDNKGNPHGELRMVPYEVYSDDDKAVAEILRDTRVRLGISLREAAHCFECSVTKMSSLEQGRVGPATTADLVKAFRLLVGER